MLDNPHLAHRNSQRVQSLFAWRPSSSSEASISNLLLKQSLSIPKCQHKADSLHTDAPIAHPQTQIKSASYHSVSARTLAPWIAPDRHALLLHHHGTGVIASRKDNHHRNTISQGVTN